jgi:hypothetical protein
MKPVRQQCFKGDVMRKGDVQCPHCGAGYRKIEISSMKGEAAEYRCQICNSPLETLSGQNYVAYRLTVPPQRMLSEDMVSKRMWGRRRRLKSEQPLPTL